MAQISNSEIFSIPGQVSLDDWNMLYQRETEMRARLQNADRPITTQDRHNLVLFGEARIDAVATLMPARRNRSKDEWLEKLSRTSRSIRKTDLGGIEFYHLLMARKEDTGKAIEMGWTSLE